MRLSRVILMRPNETDSRTPSLFSNIQQDELMHRVVYTRTNEHVLSLGSYRTDAHGFERSAQGSWKWIGRNDPGD